MRLPASGVVMGALLAGAGVSEPRVASAQDGEILPPGTAVTRELEPGATDVLRVELEAGALVDAIVEQQGLDVAVTVVEPDGTSAVDVDVWHDPMRIERVLWISRAPGMHSLRIRARPGRPRGRYRIVLEAPRTATPSDGERVSAETDYLEAVRVGAQGLDQTIPEERRLLEGALARFRAAGDPRAEAAALEAISSLESYANRSAQALAAAEQALPLYRALHDRAGEGMALEQMAVGTCGTGDLARCLERYQDAIRLARDIPDEWLEGISLNRVGTAYMRSGEAEKAIEWHRQAVVKAQASGNGAGEAAALNNLGIAYREIGELGESLASYEQALARFEALKDAPSVTRVLNNLGNVYKQQGDYLRARNSYLKYLALARERDPGGDDEARALANLGSVSGLLGDHAAGAEQSRRSLEIRTRLGDVAGQATSLHNLAENLRGLGRSDEAATSLREALRIRRGLGDRYAESTTLATLAEVERDRGNLREALVQAEAAVKLIEELRAAVTSPDLRASFVAAQQDKYGIYIDILMRLHEQEARGGYDAAAVQASERARARVLLDTLIEARADIRQGVDPALLDRERSLQKQLGVASGRLSRALTSRGAPEVIAQARQELAARSEEYREAQSRIRKESPRYAALTQPVPAGVDQIRRDLLDTNTILLEFYLGSDRSFLWAVTPTELVSQVLPARGEIERAARAVHALMTTRQRTQALASLREADRRLESESMGLSRRLFGALATRLATDWKGKRLLVVASGALSYLPFGALPLPNGGAAQPLLRDHEIVFVPSASVLIAMRQEQGPGAVPGTSVAVLADPVFDLADPRVHTDGQRATEPAPPPAGLTRAMDSLGHGFTRLPFSRAEADAIATLVPRASLLEATDFAANRRLVAEGGLGHRAVIHFATHGLLDSEHPDLSGLVLSLVDASGKPQDGFLRMQEIYNLRLPAELVVLSACQTALGREVRGEGFVGLTRGFMYAGARRVAASLWEVDDESTAELMKRFYRAMLKDGRRPADALRAAQLELSRHPRWAAPFYWAGFVLQGEFR
jgi:CHAT domain-containing protein/Tfp pilus assembly protein PilF